MNNSEKIIIKYKYCKNKKLLKWYSNQILYLNILCISTFIKIIFIKYYVILNKKFAIYFLYKKYICTLKLIIN